MIELLLQAERALTMGLVDQAEHLYRQAADADPRNSIAVVGLARVALERADDDGAWRLAKRALRIDPENAAARRMVERLEEVWAHRGHAVPEEFPVASTVAPVAAPVAPVVAARPEPKPEPDVAAEPEAEAEAEAVDEAATESWPLAAETYGWPPVDLPHDEPASEPSSEPPPVETDAVVVPIEPEAEAEAVADLELEPSATETTQAPDAPEAPDATEAPDAEAADTPAEAADTPAEPGQWPPPDQQATAIPPLPGLTSLRNLFGRKRE